VEVELLGEQFRIERIGTDGDFEKAIALLRQLDGQVDAIGLGGIDIYLFAEDKRYVIRDSKKLVAAVSRTPVVDGSGLKLTLEKLAVQKLEEKGFSFKGKKVLMVSAVDRWGMACALNEAGAQITFGDLIFGLGIPIPIRTFESFRVLARALLPIVVQMPFKVLYPTGKEQEKEPDPKYARFYEEADVIAGDFLFLRKYLPSSMDGKWILTNTITADDVEDLRTRRAAYLFTTTPEFDGRSFGTNVMEAVFIALLGKRPDEVTTDDYLELLKKLNYEPRVEKLV
jgi:hypothetical protein